MIVCDHWTLNPKNPSNEKTLYILYGPKDKPKMPLTITGWKINGSQIRGTVAIPGKPSDEAILTWGGRMGPRYVTKYELEQSTVYVSSYFKRNSYEENIQKLHTAQQSSRKFDREAESRVALTKQMVLNPKNYGNAIVLAKR